jgi:hypothetical protein
VLIAGLLILAMVGAGGWWIGGRRNGPGAVAAAGELEALRERLNRLEREQGREPAAPLGAAPAATRAADKSNRAASPPRSASDSAAKAHRASPKEQYLALEANFASDPIDATWAQPTEVQIKNAVRRFSGTELVSAACRSKLCRLEVKYSTREARDTFESENGQLPPFANTHMWMQRFRGEGNDPTSRSVIIVSREGPLPLI